jgi:hypothetical protein
VYDFIASGPGGAIGVEVKTTIIASWTLIPGQVEKDVVVANKGGYVKTTGELVDAVEYHTYCFDCHPILATFQNAALYVRLLLNGVQFIPRSILSGGKS